MNYNDVYYKTITKIQKYRFLFHSILIIRILRIDVYFIEIDNLVKVSGMKKVKAGGFGRIGFAFLSMLSGSFTKCPGYPYFREDGNY